MNGACFPEPCVWLEGTPSRGLWGGKARGASPPGGLSRIPAVCFQVLRVWPPLAQALQPQGIPSATGSAPPWLRLAAGPIADRPLLSPAREFSQAPLRRAPGRRCLYSLWPLGGGKQLLSLPGVKGPHSRGKDGPHAIEQGGAASSHPGLRGSAESVASAVAPVTHGSPPARRKPARHLPHRGLPLASPGPRRR